MNESDQGATCARAGVMGSKSFLLIKSFKQSSFGKEEEAKNQNRNKQVVMNKKDGIAAIHEAREKFISIYASKGMET